MKKAFLLLAMLLFGVAGFAQQVLWGRPSVVSPQINSDNTVTFRFVAPNASAVEVTGDFLSPKKMDAEFGQFEAPGSAALTKGENGVWEYTTKSPLAPELYNYSFVVDGLNVTDPNNVYLVRDVASVFNIFIIGGDRADLYKVNDVPHGTVSRRWYDSPTLGLKRRISVYTPAGYETSNQNYPVLYLLHGMGGDEEAWLTLGRTAQILDNLIAQGKAKPMIVVMPNGNVSQEAAPGETSLGLVQPNIQLPKTMEGSMEQSFPDIVKFVDSNFRTIAKKGGRAIAGLSMGGFHSLHTSKYYPDMFDYVGLFSAAINPSQQSASPIYSNMEGKLEAQFSQNPKLYWIAIGKTDFLYKDNEAFRKLLDSNGCKYEYFETDGGHIWRNWRIYLSEFAPKLFQ